MFNSNSADKPPGKGILESLSSSDEENKIYDKLSNTKHWRRMLSNSYQFRFEFEDNTWNSIDHYCCSKAFSMEDNEYSKFVVGGEYSEYNSSQLKKLLPKYKRNYDDVCTRYQEVALWHKFSDKYPMFKQLLLDTHVAVITYWNRGTPTVVDEDSGLKFSEKCVFTELIEKIRNELTSNCNCNCNSNSHNNSHNDSVIVEDDEQCSHPQVPKASQEHIISSQSSQGNHPEEPQQTPSVYSQGLKILAKKDINDYSNFLNNYDPSKNRSVNVLTIYERTNVIGVRMEQLAMGADSFLSQIELAPLKNVKQIAFKEFELRKIPFLICRKFSDNIKEYWKLQDLIY